MGIPQFVVYFAQCPEHGPEHRFYREQDIRSAGDLDALELEIEADTYWFARLGRVRARRGFSASCGLGHYSFFQCDIERLPDPGHAQLRPGRRHPAFGLGKAEYEIFESIFRGATAYLHNWARIADDGFGEAYSTKEVKIEPDALRNLAATLAAKGTATEAIQITMLNYWWGPKDSSRLLSSDSVLGAFSYLAVIQLCRSASDTTVKTNIRAFSVRAEDFDSA